MLTPKPSKHWRLSLGIVDVVVSVVVVVVDEVRVVVNNQTKITLANTGALGIAVVKGVFVFVGVDVVVVVIVENGTQIVILYNIKEIKL